MPQGLRFHKLNLTSTKLTIDKKKHHSTEGSMGITPISHPFLLKDFPLEISLFLGFNGVSGNLAGWWLGPPSEKDEFVTWDDEILN